MVSELFFFNDIKSQEIFDINRLCLVMFTITTVNVLESNAAKCIFKVMPQQFIFLVFADE